MQYYCRFIFKQFSQENINAFLNECENYPYETITNFELFEDDSKSSSKKEINLFEEKEERRFSFELADNPDFSDKYDKLTLAFCEMSMKFKEFERHYKTRYNNHTVTLTLLSKNISPLRFELQNIFSLNKVAFGSISCRRFFAPTYRFYAPKECKDAFDVYLRDQRDIPPLEFNMLSIFEHDRDAFVVAFPDKRANFQPKADASSEELSKTGERVVEIKVKYSAIRRLIVTLHYNKEDGITATFYFQLRYPVMIYIYDAYKDKNSIVRFRGGNRWLTWRGKELEKSISHASTLVLESYKVEGRVLMDCLDRLRKNIDSPVEFRFLGWRDVCSINDYTDADFFNHVGEDPDYKFLLEPKYFSLIYAIEALICYGGELYDHFFRPRNDGKNGCFFDFLNNVLDAFESDVQRNPKAKIAKTITVLETMLQQIQGATDIPPPMFHFNNIYKNKAGLKVIAELTEELNKEGYMRVRKLVVTPTRKLYLNPELIMGNRSLRRKKANNMLRVVFRDDDNNKVSHLPKPLIEKTVTETLENPVLIGTRKFSYLCSSNSQLRDHGCYFLAGTAAEVAKFRLECGRFKFTSIPKAMSRMGQCFTQARQLQIEIQRESYSQVWDYKGGADSNGEPYTFSDGVGMISPSYVKKIVEDLKIGNCLPCCFQIRFRGYKGIVLMNSLMEEIKEWAKQNGRLPERVEGQADPWYNQSLLFRESQHKFYGPQEIHIEIVKVSAPISVSLNKPLINILDQVSEMQSIDSHNRISNRVHELLELHVDSAVSPLYDEVAALLTLNEFPKYILYNRLKDFYLTEEPFFRSLLRSSALVALHKLIDKMQIHIPTSQGRMAFGVVDETGLLQYGQVFYRFTNNATIKFPGPHAQKTVLKGPVLITKNPSVVAGDIRMFEAVDIPCLHDLVDVVIFPQHGPRPHPDEMAGSDLDGDEYSIFWDPSLFIERNEPAFDFTATAANKVAVDEKEVKKNFTRHMIEFFTKYISQDAIGKIANAHLANSDLYGINSEHCFNVAKKHNQAVDFPKSGETPTPLTTKWENGLPPERVERFPNFMCKNNTASYKSVRLLGDLFNRCVEIREILRIEEISDEQEVVLDGSVLMSGDSLFYMGAQNAYSEYSSAVESLMEDYGIQKEGQLFSGRFTALKKQISDRDTDDMSLYNTQHMIEEQVAIIYSKFRTKFFEEFDGIEKNTSVDENLYNGVRETFRRVCTNPTEKIRRKASAYYRMAYTDTKHLSFAWLVSDILAYNRQQYLLLPENRTFSLCPLYDRLSDHMENSIKAFNKEFNGFKKLIETTNTARKDNQEMSYFVAEICQRYGGLAEMLFFIREWTAKHNITNISKKAIDALFVVYGIGELKKNYGFLDAISFNDGESINLKIQIGGLGKRFWEFVRYLMTRSFGFTGNVSLSPALNGESLTQNQCQTLYYLAMDTFYSIAANRRFEKLPNESDEVRQVKKHTEGFTFAIELPQTCHDYAKLLTQVALKCDCARLALRRKPIRAHSKNCLIAVKPVGTFVSIQRFRSLLEVKPRVDVLDLQTRSDMIVAEVHERIKFYSRPEVNINDVFPYENLSSSLLEDKLRNKNNDEMDLNESDVIIEEEDEDEDEGEEVDEVIESL